MKRWTWLGVAAALAVVAGCTESNPYYLEPDAEDDGGETAGDVPPADADADVPDEVEAETGADADVDAEPDGDVDVEPEADVPPPCTAGETRCAGDALETCQSDGTWLAAPCDDGCADGPPAHCGTWDPSNIDPALFDAGDGTLGPDGAWPSNDARITINTETGAISAGWMDGVRDAGTGLDEDTGIYFEVVPQGEGLPSLGVFAMASAVIPEDTTITVTGDHAFVLVVDGELRVGGRIDCGAATSGGWNPVPVPGPGAFDGAAGPGVGAAGIEDPADAMLDGGGGGGSFGGAGATGGYGTIGGAAGTTYGTPELVPLLGGSSGGDGADEPGEGGTGGGACAFLSRTAIVVETTGELGAPGLGGRGADASGGGGGGGSGGGLLLEAPSVTVAGTLAVNGGGGGAGAESQYRDGDDGARGRFDTTAAAGGTGTGAGCSGGEGSALAELGGPSVCDGEDDDGGGGGGGSGRIRINARTLDVSAGTFSPALGTAASTTGALPVS